MPAKKRALGRGLDSLIAPQRNVSETSKELGLQVLEIPVGSISPNPHQPRKVFHEQEIAELAESIKEMGILQPLTVRKSGEAYELVAGERRLRASQSIGLKRVPCIVKKITDEESLEWALIENLQREDLNPMEEARGYQDLLEIYNQSQEEVAKRVGKGRSTIANSLRLLKLPLDIQEDLMERRISAGHARAILAVEKPAAQRQLRNTIVTRGLSVREAEREARRLNGGNNRKPPRSQKVDAQMRSLQEEFSMKLGLQVFIRPVSDSAGKVEIQYHSLEDFEALASYFGIETNA